MGSTDVLAEAKASIEEADLMRNDKVTKVMSRLIYTEFDQIRKNHNKKLEKIIFGNGTYLIVVKGQDSRKAWDHYEAPAYAKTLCELCHMAVMDNISGVDDIVAEE